MAKKLHYFDLNCLGESIRYLLHYGGQEFEDIRYNYGTWPIQEVKDTLPYGQLPIYQEGHRTLNQSLAIARYIAHQVGLLPTDPYEQAVLDAYVFDIYDFWSLGILYLKENDPAKKMAIKKEVLEEKLDYFFTRFEKTLRENNGHFIGKLTWADFVLVGIVETANLFFGIHVEDKYPTVRDLMQTIRNLPGVKAYIATRRAYTYNP